MTVRASDESKPIVDEFEDEFDTYLEQAKQNPVFSAEYEDTSALHRLIDGLVKLRKALGLSQAEVANRMGIRQPTVSGFEKESSDPKLSTLQRYARAVEARLSIEFEMPANCDWVSPGTSAYGRDRTGSRIKRDTPVVRQGSLALDWSREPSNTRSDYGRAS